MYGKILVPVGGSETSTRGLHEAIKIAKAQGSQLRLVHIVNEFTLNYTYAPGLYAENLIESFVKAGREVLDSAKSRPRRLRIAAMDFSAASDSVVSSLMAAVRSSAANG